MSLEINSIAPDFTAPIQSGGTFTLSEQIGKWIVLYFYPKDNTPGCTKEACSFRDYSNEIKKQGAIVIGVSPDDAESHKLFIEQQNLNFDLIADPDKAVCNLYEAIGEKKMYGKKIIGVIRSTFLISPEGLIKYIWRNVKVDGHTEDVLNKLNELKNN